MDVKSETLLVPYEYYDEALAFCNARRAELSLEPITELPAGFGGNERSCPCANTVPNLYVNEKSWQYGHMGECFYLSHPTRFVEFFDKHAVCSVITKPIRDEERATHV